MRFPRMVPAIRNIASSLSRHLDLVVGTSVVIPGIIVATFGLANIPRFWLIGGTLVLTAAGYAWGRSLTVQIPASSRITCLHMTVVLLMVFVIGSWVYAGTAGSDDESARTYGFILRTDINRNPEIQCLQPSGYAGGPQLNLTKENQPLPPLCGGQTYPFECYSVLSSGERWFRLSSSSYWAGYWASGTAIYPAQGVANADIPSCRS